MIARFTGLVVFSLGLFAGYDITICPAATFDEPDAKENHRKNVADAVLDVSKAMAIEISKSIQQKDYMQAEKLSLSLELFLTSENHPAASIIVPQIAQSYAAKRKESAKEVYQQYQALLSKTQRGTESVHSEMEAFVAMEKQLQMTNPPAEPPIETPSSMQPNSRMPFDLPSRKAASPASLPPSSKATTTPKASQKRTGKSAVLDADKLNQWNDRIASIKEEYDRKFANATTDLQRQKVAQANKPEAIKRCLKLIDETHIEVRCKLLNSQSSNSSDFPYTITLEVIDSTVNLPNEFRTLRIARTHAAIAQSPTETPVRIKIPVVAVENTSKATNDLKKISRNIRRTLAELDSPRPFATLPDEDPLAVTDGLHRLPESLPWSETELGIHLFVMLPAATLELDEEPQVVSP